MLLYQILASTVHGKYRKSHTETIKLKYLPLRGVLNSIYLMDHILHQIFLIISITPSECITLHLVT